MSYSDRNLLKHFSGRVLYSRLWFKIPVRQATSPFVLSLLQPEYNFAGACTSLRLPSEGSSGVFYVATSRQFDDPLIRVSGYQRKCQSSASGDFYNPAGWRGSLRVYKMTMFICTYLCKALFFSVYFLVSTSNIVILPLLSVIYRICCRAYRNADE